MRLTPFLVIWSCLSATAPEIKPVVNEGLPAKPLTISLTESLRLGPNRLGDAGIWTGAGVTFEIDDSGHIYIADPGERRLLRFSPEGKLISQTGGQGEGPGEFQILSDLSLVENKTLIAFQNLQGITYFDYFDMNLVFQRRQTNPPVKLFMQSVDFSPDGEFVASLFMAPDGESEEVWVKTGLLSKSLEPLLVLTQAKQTSFDQSRSRDSQYWSEFLAQWFRLGGEGLGVVAFGPEGAVYTAVSNKYEITRWQRQAGGKLDKSVVFTRKYKPKFQDETEIMAMVEPMREQLLGSISTSLQQITTPAVVKRAVDLAEIPPAKPPVFGLIPVEQHGLLVIHENNLATGVAVADFFSPDGVWQGSVKLPPIPINLFSMLTGGSTKMTFRGGFAYTMETGADGDLNLVRYRYTIEPAK